MNELGSTKCNFKFSLCNNMAHFLRHPSDKDNFANKVSSNYNIFIEFGLCCYYGDKRRARNGKVYTNHKRLILLPNDDLQLERRLIIMEPISAPHFHYKNFNIINIFETSVRSKLSVLN